jgi:hypothetical protein
MASEAGKGSSQRPTNYDSYSANYDQIFGKKASVVNTTIIFKHDEVIQNEQSGSIPTDPPVDQG